MKPEGGTKHHGEKDKVVRGDKGKLGFGKLRDAYAVCNKTCGKSPHTVRWYDFRLDLYERYLDEQRLGDGKLVFTLLEVTGERVSERILSLIT